MSQHEPGAIAVEQREVSWQLPGSSEPVTVPYAINSPKPDKLLMTGFGEEDIVAIAQALGKRGIANLAVCNLVYVADTEGHLTPEMIGQSILKGTAAVVHAIHAQNPERKQIIGIGNSKGAGEQIAAANAYPWLWSHLIESAPLGLNNQSLGDTLRIRRKELITRMKTAGLTRIQPMVSRLRFREMKSGIDYALEQDGVGMVRRLHGLGLMKRLFVGEQDVIFRADELEQELGLSDFVERLEGVGHVALTCAEGLDSMAQIINRGLADAVSLDAAV